MPTESDSARFWSKVDQSGDCWLWMAGRTRAGYGQFQMDGRPHVAHRAAWMLTNGPIPNGALVLHSCDNPPCVNPAHLRLGTPADNNADKISRDRFNKNPRQRPPEYVSGEPDDYLTLAQMGTRLGVSPSTLRIQVGKGKLIAAMLGKTYLVSEREVERYRAESLGKRRPK